MSIEPRPSRSIDYSPCRYGSSKIRFRGPARRICGEYVAFIGGTETFGRFIENPYPSLIEKQTGYPAVNLGCLQAGIDAFISSPELIDICSMAKVTVIQIMGATNMSNRFYTVDPRHNHRFMRASKQCKAIYPEVDFSEFERAEHVLTALAQVGPERLPLVRQELQSAWVARMRSLLAQIDGRKVLLWMSDHEPFSATKGGTICREPLFVDRAMLNAVAEDAEAIIELVADSSEITEGRKQLVFSDFERVEANEMLGPIVHDRVSELLVPFIGHNSAALSENRQADEADVALL